MLQNKIRTPHEIKQYLNELKKWLNDEEETLTEEMSNFFSRRIDIYDDVHLEHWAEEYRYIADFFDDNLKTLLDIGCGTGLELEAIYKRFPNVNITGIDSFLSHHSFSLCFLLSNTYFSFPSHFFFFAEFCTAFVSLIIVKIDKIFHLHNTVMYKAYLQPASTTFYTSAYRPHL